jgi:hypothetical protein
VRPHRRSLLCPPLECIRRTSCVLCLAFWASSCGDAPPTGPTVTTSPGYSLSGIVTERFSQRPIEGARVYVWPQRLTGGGFPAGFEGSASDAGGRYRVSSLPAVGPVWVIAYQARAAFKKEYMQSCVATATVEGDSILNLTVSSTAHLTPLNSAPQPMPANSRMVSGMVYETTATGRQPVMNAWVMWTPVPETFLADISVFFAETRSDSAGHYLLCGLPNDRTSYLLAYVADGRVTEVTLDPGQDLVVDIEIAR